MTKRLRIFAGPNGSGKSTLYQTISESFPTGIFINADLIEKDLNEVGFIDINKFNLKISEHQFDTFIENASIVHKAKSEGLNIKLGLNNSKILSHNSSSNSYEAALIADLIRSFSIERGNDFSFETVFSHDAKLKMLERARELDYKIYLYYICLKLPEINVNRVANRVLKGGHPVPTEKTISRYFRSLDILEESIKLSYRSYIFDNSEINAKLILEIFKGKEITIKDKNVPIWVDTYVLKKML